MSNELQLVQWKESPSCPELMIGSNGTVQTKHGAPVKIQYTAMIPYKNKWKQLHRLVAEAFIEQKDDAQVEVDHIDRNRLNNRVTNLRYVTRAQNQANGVHAKMNRVSVRYQ